MYIEFIATTIEDALIIEESGADRIELVSSLAEGGLTPSHALIEAVVNSVKIPVNVMVRPHSQSFCYTQKGFGNHEKRYPNHSITRSERGRIRCIK